MGKDTGFMEFTRETPTRRPVSERVNDWFEIYLDFPEEKIRKQGARCMDCGVPFCHTGCPLNNIIPDWNDLVYRGRWREAIRVLHSTNNFPEFTGRICPAPCEAACVLGINEPRGHHQADRENHRRLRLRPRLDSPGAAGSAHRQARGGRRLRASGAGGGATTGARRPLGHSVRKERPHRRPAALRHPEFQNGEAPHRPAHGANVGRGRRVPAEFARRRQRAGGRPAQRVRRHPALRRRRVAARSERARPRIEGHPFRHGFSAAAEQSLRRRYGRRARFSRRASAS